MNREEFYWKLRYKSNNAGTNDNACHEAYVKSGMANRHEQAETKRRMDRDYANTKSKIAEDSRQAEITRSVAHQQDQLAARRKSPMPSLDKSRTTTKVVLGLGVAPSLNAELYHAILNNPSLYNYVFARMDNIAWGFAGRMMDIIPRHHPELIKVVEACTKKLSGTKLMDFGWCVEEIPSLSYKIVMVNEYEKLITSEDLINS